MTNKKEQTIIEDLNRARPMLARIKKQSEKEWIFSFDELMILEAYTNKFSLSLEDSERIDKLVDLSIEERILMSKAFSIALLRKTTGLDPKTGSSLQPVDNKDEDLQSLTNADELLTQLDNNKELWSLILNLKSEDKSTCFRSMEALGNLGESVVRPLIMCLKYQDRKVRSYTAIILGNIRDIRAVQPLVETLKDTDSDVRYYATQALVKFGESAVMALIKGIKDENANFRSLIAFALGEIGDERGLEPLIEAIKDKDVVVRYTVAGALGQFGSTKALPYLETLLFDISQPFEWLEVTVANLAAVAIELIKEKNGL